MNTKEQLQQSIELEQRKLAEKAVKDKFGISAGTFEHLVKLEIDLLRSEK